MYTHSIANAELRLMESHDVSRAIVLELTRRVAVHRLPFQEDPDPRNQYEDVEVRAEWPASWWDHAKQDVRLLRWAMGRGWLDPVAMAGIMECKRVAVQRWVSEVTVLDDDRELPAHMQRLEVRYSPDRRWDFDGMV